MPVVESVTIFKETLKACKQKPDRSGLSGQVTDQQCGFTDLLAMSALVCEQILLKKPEAVLAVANHTRTKESLNSLILETAEQTDIKMQADKKELLDNVLRFLFGYGPLQAFIEDDLVSDIDATGPGQFTVKRLGVREFVPVTFVNARAYDTFCRLLILRNNGVINENDSHCRVADYKKRLRINVCVPPRSYPYPVISIRKHQLRSLRLKDLLDRGMINSEQAGQITSWARARRSVLICGTGAAGKTTLLRAWIEEMSELDRVLVAESDAELFPEKPCCFMQRIKPKEAGGRPVSLADLVTDGLTMSLDAYCIGEIVGTEALALIQASFSGHCCLATIHARQAKTVPERLLTLARPGWPGESDRTLRRMIGSGLDLIIHIEQYKIAEIIEVHGYLEKEDRYDLETIWPVGPDQAGDQPAGQFTESLVPGA